jgi:hypothetical protein
VKEAGEKEGKISDNIDKEKEKIKDKKINRKQRITS